MSRILAQKERRVTISDESEEEVMIGLHLMEISSRDGKVD